MIDNALNVQQRLMRHIKYDKTSGCWEWSETWWEETPEEPRELFDEGWACSCCGRYLLRYLQENFHDVPGYADCESPDIPPTVKRCPCCGAKMEGGDQDASD